MFTSSKAPFTWRKVKGLPSFPNYPERANFSYISLQNLTNCLHEKQKDRWVRRVNCLAGSPSSDSSVSLLARPTLLYINTFDHPAGSTRRRRHHRNIRSQLLTRAKGSNFFAYKRSLKLTRLRRVTLLPETTFLPQNRV